MALVWPCSPLINLINANLQPPSNYYLYRAAVFIITVLFNRPRRDLTASTNDLLIGSHIFFSFMLIGSDAILAPKPAQIRTMHQNSSHSLVKGQHVERKKLVDEFADDACIAPLNAFVGEFVHKFITWVVSCG